MKLEQFIPLDRDFQLLSREFSIYYCTFCRLILTISPEPLKMVEEMVVASSSGRCPDCGSEFGLSLKHERYLGNLGDQSYIDSRLNLHSLYRDHHDLESLLDFASLSALTIPIGATNGLSSRPVLLLGENALIRGHYECAQAALSGRVVFLDGGNTFNSSHLRESVDSELADFVMDNTIVSRAFNYHQLTSLVVDKLPETLHSHVPTTIAIFEPTMLYEEDDVIDQREAWNSFKRMAWTLRRISLNCPRIRMLMVLSRPVTEAGRMLQNICGEQTARSLPRQ